jgi:hypothetical protein
MLYSDAVYNHATHTNYSKSLEEKIYIQMLDFFYTFFFLFFILFFFFSFILVE